MKKSIQSASKTSLALLTKFFEEEMGDIIEAERKVTHMKLAERVEAKLDDQKFLKSQKLGADVHLLAHLAHFSSTQTSWNGRIRQLYKVAEYTISVLRLCPMTTIFMEE
jgi:nucleosome binding factor SPN SPT16 subunit